MKTFFRLLLFVILMAIVGRTYAQQVEYHYYDTQDSIKIEYRWARANLFDRNSDAVLYLQFTNESTNVVSIDYSVGFYREEQIMVEAPGNKVQLKPGQRRRGSRSDMRFSAPGIDLSMVEEAWFSWDIFKFDVSSVK